MYRRGITTWNVRAPSSYQSQIALWGFCRLLFFLLRFFENELRGGAAPPPPPPPPPRLSRIGFLLFLNRHLWHCRSTFSDHYRPLSIDSFTKIELLSQILGIRSEGAAAAIRPLPSGRCCCWAMAFWWRLPACVYTDKYIFIKKTKMMMGATTSL